MPLSTTPKTLYSPRYWPTWLGIALLRCWAPLPWPLQYRIARILGMLANTFARRRRHIVNVNLRLCFPEWDEETRNGKVREVLFNNVLGLAEAANAYHRPTESFRDQVTIRGLQHLQLAHARGRGVILLGAHYSHLDFGGALVSLVCNPCAIYRPNNNALMDRYILQGRSRFMKSVILRSDMRGIARALKKNEVVWYPPDQDYGRKHSVFAPFFGVNAATITATSRLVKLNQSPVVAMSCYRQEHTDRYFLEFQPLTDAFPSGSDERDARLINQALENCIRKSPTQYMWTHRRFKTQPEGRAMLYQ